MTTQDLAFSNWLESHIFTASDLENFILCPFRFYLTAYLKIPQPTQFEAELSGATIGKLIHRILEKSLRENKLTLQPLLPLLQENLEKEWPLVIQAQHSPALVSIQKQKIQRTLSSFSEEFHKEMQEEDLKPKFFEWSFQYTLTTPQGRTISFKGRVDRIDTNPQNQFLIYDYKTGSRTISGSQILSGNSFQLPLYLLAVQEKLLPHSEAIGALYYSLSDFSKKDGILHQGRLPRFLNIHPRNSSLIPEALWEKTVSLLKWQIGSKIDEIFKSNFLPLESVRTEACENQCPYHDLCQLRGGQA